MKPVNPACADDTSLAGYVDTTYAALVAAFGPPNGRSDGYKVDACWVLAAGGRIVTVYNWKDGPAYRGAAGTPVEAITTWHIGAHFAPAALAAMRRAFPGRVSAA